MSDKKKWIRPKSDGRFEALRSDASSTGYDQDLDAATAHQMMTQGGYEARASDDPDFEAIRLLAGLDMGGSPAEDVALSARPDGRFNVDRTLRSGARSGSDVDERVMRAIRSAGGSRIRSVGPDDSLTAQAARSQASQAPRVTPGSAKFVDVSPSAGAAPRAQDYGDGKRGGASMATGRELDAAGMLGDGLPEGKGTPTQDYSDAKLSGMSNPQLQQDWSDTGPRPSMPRGGAARPRPSIQVQRPETGDPDGYLQRLQASARGPSAAAGRAGLAPGQPAAPAAAAAQVDAYDQARGESARRRFGTQIARAGAMVNEAISGAKMDRAAWDDLEAQSQEPLQDLAAKRKMRFEDAAEGRAVNADARAGRADTRAQAGEGREADLSDPASRVSRTARAQMLLRYPRQAAQLSREELAAMSAADVQSFLKGFGEDRDDAARSAQHSESIAARRAALGESRADRAQRQAELAASKEAQAAQKRQDMLDRQGERDQAELGKRSQGNADLYDDLTTITGFLDADGAQGDLPGVGPVASAMPEMLTSSDGVKLRSAALRLYRGVVRQESGQTVTPQEAATALEAFGMGPGKSETAFRQGMAALAQRAQRALRNTESGFSKGVVDERRARGGITSQDIPRPGPTPTGRRKRAPDGSVWEELSDGSARQVQ